ALGMAAEAFLHHLAGLLDPAEVEEPLGAEGELPGGGLEALRLGADRHDRGSRLERLRHTVLSRLEEDERAGRCVELLFACAEARPAADDDVELLVRVGVLLDDEVALLLAAVRVDAEGADAERVADRLPLEQAAERRERLDLVQVQPLHAGASRSAPSTTGSIASSPSTRSSRFSTLAHAP